MMLACFIALTFIYAFKDAFSYFSLIPVCLMGFLPAAILICIVRSLYPPKDSKKQDIISAIPVKLIADTVRDLTSGTTFTVPSSLFG